jgi:hypothetical protein
MNRQNFHGICLALQEHIGTPTQSISPSWSQDLVQSMNALHEDFQMRWQGHVTLQPKVVPRSQEQEDELAGAVEANEALKLGKKKMGKIKPLTYKGKSLPTITRMS